MKSEVPLYAPAVKMPQATTQTISCWGLGSLGRKLTPSIPTPRAGRGRESQGTNGAGRGQGGQGEGHQGFWLFLGPGWPAARRSLRPLFIGSTHCLAQCIFNVCAPSYGAEGGGVLELKALVGCRALRLQGLRGAGKLVGLRMHG